MFLRFYNDWIVHGMHLMFEFFDSVLISRGEKVGRVDCILLLNCLSR